MIDPGDHQLIAADHQTSSRVCYSYRIQQLVTASANETARQRVLQSQVEGYSKAVAQLC